MIGQALLRLGIWLLQVDRRGACDELPGHSRPRPAVASLGHHRRLPVRVGGEDPGPHLTAWSTDLAYLLIEEEQTGHRVWAIGPSGAFQARSEDLADALTSAVLVQPLLV